MQTRQIDAIRNEIPPLFVLEIIILEPTIAKSKKKKKERNSKLSEMTLDHSRNHRKSKLERANNNISSVAFIIAKRKKKVKREKTSIVI